MLIIYSCSSLLDSMIEKTGKPWRIVFKSVEFDRALCDMFRVDSLEDIKHPDFWTWYNTTANAI